MKMHSLLGAVLLAAPLSAQPELSNESIRIRFGAQSRGGLESVSGRAGAAEFLARQKEETPFRLTVVDNEGKARELGAADADSWEVSSRDRGSAREVTLTYKNLARLELDVVCSIMLDGRSPLSQWRVAVRNGSQWALRSMIYPVLKLSPQLGADGSDDRLLYPVHHGQLLSAPGASLSAGRLVKHGYPGSASVQFLAYYDGTAGLYLAAYDGGGHPKHFGVERREDGIRLVLEHNIPEQPGRDWKLPYDAVLGTFQGDWHAAADIYRSWAEQQSWCARKLRDRSDIPGWYLRGLPILMFVPRGRETEPLEPPGLRPEAPKLFREISALFRSPVVVVEYGWEKHGSWLNPDVFPPYGGDAAFKEQLQRLAADGNIFGCYLSGTRWSLKKPGTLFDGSADFERLARPAATTSENQEPIVETRPWATNVRLCISSPLTRRFLLDEVRGLAERGVLWVQYDQNLGCEAYVCYNRGHKHPGGFGRWMSEDTRSMLAETRRAGKSLNRDFALSVEEPCEYYIQDLDGYNDRPYVYAGFPLSLPQAEAIPLFSYLYHEYALGFGGDSAIRLKHPHAPLVKLARGIAAGLLVEGPALSPKRAWPKEEQEFMAAIVEAQQRFAHDYLIYGRMMPPPRLDNVPDSEGRILETAPRPATPASAAQQTTSPGENLVEGRPVRVPSVFCSAWRGSSGKTGYILANVTGEPVRPMLRIRETGSDLSPYRFTLKTPDGERELTLPGPKAAGVVIPLNPRQVVLVEQERLP